MAKCKLLASAGFACFALIFLSGCGSGVNRDVGGEERKVSKNSKIVAEAWLFDSQVRQKGKPTSFRLEVFRQDSLTAISGRGYLGKGGMKGLISDDTLMIYFPISNEFVWESASTLLSDDSCASVSTDFNLRSLLHNLPIEILAESTIQVKTIFSEAKAQAFELSTIACYWSLELHYDLTDVGWRLKRFIFDDGDSTRVKGDRRKFKPGAKVPLKRFQLAIPPDALQLHH